MLAILIYGLNSQNQINNLVRNDSEQSNNNPNPNSENTSGISLSELTSPNSRNDCWISYGGKVYDITSFLPKHPGSAGAIIPYCGTSTDFEEAFGGQHGTSQVNRLFREGGLMGDLA